MSKEIQPPEYFASQYEGSYGRMHVLASRIRERDEQIAAWCIDRAEAADREAVAHERMVTGEHGRIVSDTSHQERIMTCPEHKAAHCGCPGSDRAIYRPPSQPQGAEPPDPPGCVWRGTDVDGPIAVVNDDQGDRALWWDAGEHDAGWAVVIGRHSERAVYIAALFSERSRADRAEAALADVSDRIAALQVAMAGGRVP